MAETESKEEGERGVIGLIQFGLYFQDLMKDWLNNLRGVGLLVFFALKNINYSL